MIRDLFVDLQDGLKLCRAIQLLQHNSSILMVSYIYFYVLEMILASLALDNSISSG